jgi:hypothetical protein
MNRNLLYGFIFIVVCNCSWGQSDQVQEPVIAKAGNVFITEKEFIERYELLPYQYRNRSSNIEESKLVFLYSLIAEKLLAQEAVERHLDQDTIYQKAMAQIRKNFARDQLYREQVQARVTVSKTELMHAMIDAKRQLAISVLYFEDSTDAAFVKKQLKNCKEFFRFQADTTIASLKDTVTLSWGEAEAPIEQAAFRLKKGECSPVVKASTGYYILHLDKEWSNSFYTSMQPQILYERVEAKVRLRKENIQLEKYLATAFLNKSGFALPKPFVAVAKTFTALMRDQTNGAEVMISDSLLLNLRLQCASILQDTMVMVGKMGWTVEEVFYKLRGKTFKIDHSRTTEIASQLNAQLLILVQQELLAEEGIAQHLDQRPSVQKELEPWRQQILSQMAEMDFKRTVQVSDQDIVHYLKDTNPEMHFPRVEIRELHTKTIAAMDVLLKEVQVGVPLEEVITRSSSDTLSGQRGAGVNVFAINERIPLGILAWRMKVGERQGPLHLNNDYIYFELLKKDYPSGMTDSSFSLLLSKEANNARMSKQKRSLDLFIAKSAQARGYAVYTDRLKLLKVSSVPMMTFRILGFGGRMFAAPFVTPQADWIGEENDEKIQLP